MSLVLGSKLGPYEIIAAIGAGGMGEVYRAEDTRLGRTVAIKVLPSTFFQVPERRKRLEREARLLSSLSHPHICHLYDIGQQDGVDYIVMEFLEGETLSARLSRSALSGEQVLIFGSEIADALEYAHRHGIIHRDLKPANIMITKQGTKLLDFGLARLDEESPAPVSETLTRFGKSDRKLTEEGVILGTFQYMAPEQLEGKDADARTDIFALGTVLYEMATAKPAFGGKTRASLIASILASEPAPITSLQPLTPPALERVIKSCLAKDPDARWQSAQDVNLQLKWIRESGSGAGVPVPLAQRRKTRERIAWALVGLLGIAAAALAAREILRHTPDPVVTRFVINPPPDHDITEFPPVRLSPDGRTIAFTVIDRQGHSTIWLRMLDSIAANEVPGSEGGIAGVWSQDSRFILFDSGDGKLKKVDIRGGLPDTLCDLKSMYPSSWGPNGSLLLGFDPDSAPPGPIQMMNTDDCRVQPVTRFDSKQYDFGHHWPSFLPDGRHFLYSGVRTDKRHDVLLGNVESLESEVLVRNGSNPKYAEPGYLFFERNGYLFTQPFSLKTLKVSGEPVQVEADQLVFAGLGGIANYDVATGVLAFEKQGNGRSQLMLVDYSGNQVEALDTPAAYSAIRISPDRTKVLVSKFNLQFHSADLWAYDLNHRNWERLTFDSAPGEHNGVWSPDGQQIIYSTFLKGHENLYRKTRSGDAEALIENNFDKEPSDWSFDGRFLLFTQNDANGSGDLWVYPLGGNEKPYAILETHFNEGQGRFSPDGHWIAYRSNESGQAEIYVRPFPGPGDKQQLSSGGGRQPHWSRDGRKLYYVTLDSKVVEVPVTPKGNTLSPGAARFLFSIKRDSEFEPISAERILVNQLIGTPASSPVVVLNWEAALNNRKK